MLPKPDCVIKVGDGRGFIIEHRARRLVITAAHCLPELPPAHAASAPWDRSYRLLGTLDGREARILTECLFVNPVADLAVLGSPDVQECYEEAAAYDRLAEETSFLQIDEARSGPGWVLSLEGDWVRTTVETYDGTSLSIGPDGSNEPGMSGSPILNDAGRAVGVVVVGAEEQSINVKAAPQSMLTRDLPGWLLHFQR
jgi:hypothetical protein